MVCVYCGSPTSVVNSRQQRRANSVWRRRKCDSCEAVITTQEAPDLSTAMSVIDTKGKQTAFLRDKLFVSIYKSCLHRKEPVRDATGLTATVVTQIVKAAEAGGIETSKISAVVTKVLARFDKAASVQYAAFHKAAK